MPSPSAVSLSYSWPNGKSVDNTQVDSWELKASRRALKNLKTLLAGQPMLDLIKNQIDEADAYYKDIIEKSNGEFKESRIDLKAKGITLTQFMAWWKVWMVELQQPDIKQQVFMDTMVPAHPEHYALPANKGGIVETIGEHIARVHIRPCANPPDFVKAYGDPSYQHLPAIGTLEDGSVLLYILQEIKDSEEGCDFRLRLLFPAAAPQVFFDEHAEHLAIEFRSFIDTAFKWNQKHSASKD
ncbi:Alpha subunit of the F1 sector of mitochondrial F1F0 ATP synthase [Mucor velutinosus]|uniref:Alpha subunit of the F1 sector of mitochondrial F1F0 ATP synthase n=1 Tax=Mucor velutinosus TaxID=708070 RepID=A0AAN7HX43_9FUNG|nr:Alpha subunit of the F1 sector of mitochondrial F1F0 ATP synthase [Mucor velutinosus]